MKIAPFKGSGVAIVTPIENGKVNYSKLSELVQYQIENKTDAIIVCGTTGEASTLNNEEHIKSIETVVKAANGKVPVIAGTGSNDTAYGIQISREAEALGADALLLVTPYYNKATQRGLIYHYTETASAVNIPMILYSVASRTGVNILPETLKELSKVPNIVAVKEASGNMAQVVKIAAICPDLFIYSGEDNLTVPIMSVGGIGVISVMANVLPREMHNLTEKMFQGDLKGACELQLSMLEIMDAMFYEVNPIPVKTAMNLLGFGVGELRLPLCDMEDTNLDKLKKVIYNYGLTL